MAFPYVPNYGGNWQTGAPGATPITEAALDNLETQFASVIALLTTQGDIIYRGAATWERRAKGTEGYYLRQGANDPAWAAVLTVSETEVFNGASPNPSAFTNLDLSGTVGANNALVVLRCYNPNAVAKVFIARPNGETEVSALSELSHAFDAAEVPGTDHMFILTWTDAAGIIEWYYESAGEANTTIDLVAYIK